MSVAEETLLDTSPMLAIWADLAPTVVRITQQHPHLASRLIAAPRSAYHSYAVYLRSAHGLDDRSLAAKLHDTDPRALLTNAKPGAPAAMYNALARAPMRVQPAGYYCRLADLLLSRVAPVVLAANEITSQTLSFASVLLRLDPLVADAHALLGWDTSRARVLADALLLLRHHGLLEADAEAARALRHTKRENLEDFLRHRLRRGHSPIRLPAICGLRQIQSVRELHAVARRRKNCLADVLTHAVDLVAGRAVFLDDGEGGGLAKVDVISDGLFTISEVEAVDTEAFRARVVSELRRAGVAVLETGPGSYQWRFAFAVLD